MSFRKRNVRPNLNLSKRSAPGTSGEKLENKGEADVLKTSQDNAILAQEPITTSNVASKPDSQLPLETKDVINKKESCDSPTLGKRLSKRTKIAPKVAQQKTVAPKVAQQKTPDTTAVSGVNLSTPCSQTSSLVCSQTLSSTPHYQERDDNTPVLSASQCDTAERTIPSLDDTNINKETSEQSGDMNINMDVIRAYNLIRDGGSTAEITREIDKNKSPVAKEGKNVGCSVSTDSSTTETVKQNRLSKRTRVMPKLTLKSLNKENRDTTSPDDDNIASELERSKVLENETININENNRTISQDQCTSDTVPTNTESTLPLLRSISMECERIINSTPSLFDGSLTKAIGIGIAGIDNEYNNMTTNNTINEQSLSVNNYFSSHNFDGDILLDKKELKHVRFTSNDYNDYSNDYDDLNNDTNLSEISSPKGCFPNAKSGENNALKVPNLSENVNGRTYDSNDDYDSMSEGEMLGKQLESKNKVFKPNLGAKRRERLSSFSAYSSCDEEDWQNQKRKKKDKVQKKPEETSEKDHIKKEEKKKKPKIPVKPKKDRENLEPNAEQVEKKKKKEKKPVAKRPPKLEERDLSSLTMQELIHYSNPSFKTVELRSKRDEDENERVIDTGSVAPAPTEQKPIVDKTPVDVDDEVMAPQIMINEDGEIVINQESLTISKTVDDSILNKSGIVYEDSLSYGTHLKRKHNCGKRWKIDETLRFYKALSEIGTDFTLMSQAFGRFTRNELKKKFKKEEKVNCDLVDRALSNRLPLNMEMFLQGKEEMKEPVEDANGNIVTPSINDSEQLNVECEVDT